MLGLRLIGLDDRNHLGLVELMLADEAARVTAGCACLGTEAGGERGEAERQIGRGEDPLAHDVGEADLAGRDQPAAVGGAEQVLGKFGELTRAEHRLVAHQQRRDHFFIAVVAGEDVQPELAERTGKLRHVRAHQREARAGQQRARFEIEAERGADGVMLADREAERRAGAAFVDQQIVILIRPMGNVGERQVGKAGEQAI